MSPSPRRHQSDPQVVFAVPAGPNDTAQRVKAVFAVGASEIIPGHTDLAVVGVYWKLPDGTEGTGGETPWFDAPTDKPLAYRLRMGDPSTAPEHRHAGQRGTGRADGAR